MRLVELPPQRGPGDSRQLRRERAQGLRRGAVSNRRRERPARRGLQGWPGSCQGRRKAEPCLCAGPHRILEPAPRSPRVPSHSTANRFPSLALGLPQLSSAPAVRPSLPLLSEIPTAGTCGRGAGRRGRVLFSPHRLSPWALRLPDGESGLREKPEVRHWQAAPFPRTVPRTLLGSGAGKKENATKTTPQTKIRRWPIQESQKGLTSDHK